MAYANNFYDGQFTPFAPEYGSKINYVSSFASFGNTTDGRTADQVKVVTNAINAGIKTIEISGGTPGVLEAIPRDQFKEINRLAKLTGITPTMHGPMIDPTGISDRGWNEENRKQAERQIWSALERSHDLNPKGNTNFTIHASTVGIPSEFIDKEDGKFVQKGIVVIDQTGRSIDVIKDDKHLFPTETAPFVGEKKFKADDAIKERNKEIWNKNLNNIAYDLDLATERLDRDDYLSNSEEMRIIKKLQELEGPSQEKEIAKSLNVPGDKGSVLGQVFLERSYDQMREFWELAWKSSNEIDKKKLKVFAENLAPVMQKWKNDKDNPERVRAFSNKLKEGIGELKKLQPQVFKPIKDFAVDKSSETVSNLALKAYKKFGDTAPVISLENHPAQTSLLTTGEDLAVTIKAARDRFVQEATKSEKKGGMGMSKKSAQEQAKKLIGATWDVGHINMLKKYGYEDKDIIDQTKAIAPYVKHVHLSDNFGLEHTELPMGMGNVPVAEIMKQLGKKGFEGKKIVEAFDWWQHFADKGGGNPIIPTLQAFNSPVYGMNNSIQWGGITGIQGSYASGPLAYLPENHFQRYGTGFSSLPQELGGQISSNSSRFSGTPNA